jgi:ketopantoate hydroxymethyltransferase
MITRDRISAQYEARRASPSQPPLKINLFKGYEVLAVARCCANLRHQGSVINVECVMLGDSLLTTHLGYETTALDHHVSQHLFLRVFNEHIHEIRLALDSIANDNFTPYLVADMPFGSVIHVDNALRHGERMLCNGAEVLKIETYSADILDTVEELSASGYLVMGHIGYTPQVGGRKSRGTTLDDALQIYDQARRVRDAGAVGLVLEGVSTVVNGRLSLPDPHGIPIYSIFSGRPQYSGLSLNVWDSVVKPGFNARFFPPTAMLGAQDVPNGYTVSVIEECMEQLLRLVIANEWPPERRHAMGEADLNRLMEIDPWHSTGK